MVRALVFDLFGTVVPSFSRSRHQQALRATADVLGVPVTSFSERWMEFFPQRASGAWSTLEETFMHVCGVLGHGLPDAATLSHARVHLVAFTRASLTMEQGTRQALDDLRATGFRLGLVSNCAPPVPELWGNTDVSARFDAVAFSCTVGSMKPDAAIYRSVCRALDVASDECLYVGDGSNLELTGATALRMQPVLVRRCCDDTYDPHRPDVESWSGWSVASIGELTRVALSPQANALALDSGGAR